MSMKELTLDVVRRCEWRSIVQGPGTSMGARDGKWFNCCPICRGVKPGNGAEQHFQKKAIGHAKGCDMKRVLKFYAEE